MKYKFIVLSERALEDAKAIIKSEGGKLFIIINLLENFHGISGLREKHRQMARVKRHYLPGHV
jgi:hypothetical protein